jgi:S-adenosylmethionine decarboxylase
MNAAGGKAGIEWVVEAFGCRAEALCSREVLEALFARAVEELGLTPVAPALWHVFPDPGGITGMLLLSESHLTCHTFPETGYAALNLYCCKRRPAWDFEARLQEGLGARLVEVRTLFRGGGIS